MAGLLDILNRNPGLLSALPRDNLTPALAQARTLLATPAPVAAPEMADAGDEAMFARAPNGTPANQFLGGQLLGQPVRRGRVSGLRVLDSFLFGDDTIASAIDKDRARLTGEANKPALDAQRQATLATITDPTERALFLQAPDVWAENAGYRLRPRTLAPGSVERVNGATVGSAPVVEKFDDRFGVYDPSNPTAGATYTDQRGATRAEDTANARLQLDADLGDRNLDLKSQEIDQRGRQFDQTFGLDQAKFEQSQSHLPDAVRKDNERDYTQITDRASTMARLDQSIKAIDTGLIDLDPARRAETWIRNNTNTSDPQSRAQAELRRTVETLRNNILNDATGPQTDGDSLRALNQIIAGWGDEQVVRQGLDEYRQIQQRKSATQQALIEQRTAQYPQARSGVPVTTGTVARPTSEAEFRALPSGTIFEAPDGTRRRKP